MSLRIEPLQPSLGARIVGLDLASLDDVGFTTLRQALDRYLVLQVEGQSLDRFQLAALGRRFGPPFFHPLVDNGFADCKQVLELRREPADRISFGGESWHSDVTYLSPAGYVSILHAQEIPPVGGDTGFSSSMAAFTALSAGLQQTLRGLKAVHSYHGPKGQEDPRFSALHPVVRRHPVTGAEGLYLNRMFAVRFEGMTADESRPLLAFLCTHQERPEFTCRVAWRTGDAVLWDNRFTLHFPINDIVGQRRVMIRTTALES
jgi:taurine dioxygenase